MFALAASVQAAQIYKDATTMDINSLSSWSTTAGAATPDPLAFGATDTLRFNEAFAPTSGTSYTASLSGDLSFGGIKVDYGAANGGTAFGNVVIDGSNTLTLNGTTSADSAYANAIIVLNSAAGGTLTVNPNIVVGAAATGIVASRNVALNGSLNWGAYGMTANIAAGTTTLAGVASGGGNWSKTGVGTFYLKNEANDFTGSVTVAGGTLQIDKLANGGSVSSIGSGSSAVVLNGGTLSASGSAVGGTTNRAIDMRAAAAISSSGVGTISFTAASVLQGGTASPRTFTLNGTNAGANTFGSALGDSGTGTNITSLLKTGTGTWRLTAANSYTGATTIQQGVLELTGSSSLGGASGSSADSGNIVFGSNLNSGRLQFETVANLGAASQIRFRNTAGGTIGAGGALVYAGTTDQTLGKTLQCDSNIGIRLESDSVGGTLTFNGAFSQTNRSLYLGGSGTGSNTLATAFSGTGGLIKRDAGKWVLTAANSYGGTTTVSGGVLDVGNGGTTGSLGSGAISVASGAEVVLNRSDALSVANTLSGSGVITKAGAGRLTVSGSNAAGALNWKFAGTDNGDIGFANAAAIGGSGSTMTLADGATGAAFFGNGGNTSDLAFSIGSGAVLTWNGSTGNTNTLSGALVGAGGLTKVSGEVLRLSGINTYSGPTVISNGTLELYGSGNLGNGSYAGAISNAGTLAVSTSSNQNLSGVVSGVGSLTKSNTGTLTLSGTNTYSGATTATAGSLVINGATSTLSTVTIGAAASLGGSGVVGGDTTIDGTLAPGNSPGLLTFSNDLTLGAGSSVVWELAADTATDRGVQWDALNVAGDLVFTGAALLQPVFDAAGSTVDFTDPFWSSPQGLAGGWRVFDVGGTITGMENLSVSSAVLLDSQGRNFGETRPGLAWSLYQGNGGIYLTTVAAIPEPGALLGLAGLLGGACLLRRRGA